MNAGGSSGWLDRVISGCFSALLGAFALYCAVQLIASIWLWLVGIVGVAALVVGGVVVFRTTHGRW